MVRITSGYFCFILCQLLIIAFSSCEKSETAEQFSNYEVVKIFDDSLASPRNDNNRIASGINRLFMAYSHSNAFSGSLDYDIHFIVTDNLGSLIKRDSIQGLNMNLLIALNDGNFGVVASNFQSTIHLFQFNRDGILISKDSINLPPDNFPTGFKRSHQGNILVCVTDIIGLNSIMECDIHGNILWSKPSPIAFSDCFLSPDGGYVIGHALQGDSITIYKINATGDQLWYKVHHLPFNIYGGPLLKTGNGNYWFAVYHQDDLVTQTNYEYGMYVYEVNASGDFIQFWKAAEEISYFFPNAIIQHDDASHFLLASSPEGTGGGYLTILSSGKASTHFTILDHEGNVFSSRYLQDKSIDLFNAACKTSDGKVACFGLIQTYQQNYFKPGLLILN